MYICRLIISEVHNLLGQNAQYNPISLIICSKNKIQTYTGLKYSYRASKVQRSNGHIVGGTLRKYLNSLYFHIKSVAEKRLDDQELPLNMVVSHHVVINQKQMDETKNRKTGSSSLIHRDIHVVLLVPKYWSYMLVEEQTK